MNLKIEIEKSDVGGEYALMTLALGDKTASLLMPTELAEALQARSEFKHGINIDGKLMAVFLDGDARNHTLDFMEFYFPGKWEKVTCG